MCVDIVVEVPFVWEWEVPFSWVWLVEVAWEREWRIAVERLLVPTTMTLRIWDGIVTYSSEFILGYNDK